MAIRVVTPPAATPVTLEEAKAHLRVTQDNEDAWILANIKAATAHVEQMLGMSLMSRTLELTLDRFADSIELPRGPVQSVASVTYIDADGLPQAVDASGYTLDLVSNPQWVVRNADSDWPDPMDAVNVVTVRYVAGYDTLPERFADIQQAILLLVGHWFLSREAASAGQQPVPFGVEALLAPHRPVLI